MEVNSNGIRFANRETGKTIRSKALLSEKEQKVLGAAIRVFAKTHGIEGEAFNLRVRDGVLQINTEGSHSWLNAEIFTDAPEHLVQMIEKFGRGGSLSPLRIQVSRSKSGRSYPTDAADLLQKGGDAVHSMGSTFPQARDGGLGEITGMAGFLANLTSGVGVVTAFSSLIDGLKTDDSGQAANAVLDILMESSYLISGNIQGIATVASLFDKTLNLTTTAVGTAAGIAGATFLSFKAVRGLIKEGHFKGELNKAVGNLPEGREKAKRIWKFFKSKVQVDEDVIQRKAGKFRQQSSLLMRANLRKHHRKLFGFSLGRNNKEKQAAIDALDRYVDEGLAKIDAQFGEDDPLKIQRRKEFLIRHKEAITRREEQKRLDGKLAAATSKHFVQLLHANPSWSGLKSSGKTEAILGIEKQVRGRVKAKQVKHAALAAVSIPLDVALVVTAVATPGGAVAKLGEKAAVVGTVALFAHAGADIATRNPMKKKFDRKADELFGKLDRRSPQSSRRSHHSSRRSSRSPSRNSRNPVA